MAEGALGDLPSPILVGHRGDPARHAENSIPGFLSALEAGVEVVEFDVRLTADGSPVVLHDAALDRTTSAWGYVHRLTLQELRGVRLGGGRATLPTLSEALVAIDAAGGGIDVEIKNVPGDPAYEATAERALEATLAALDDARFGGPVLISSFNPATVLRCRELAPGLPTGLLVVDAMWSGDARAATLGAAKDAGHAFVLPSVVAVRETGRAFVDEAHGAGLRVGTWNADDPETVRTMLEWGLDAIATNDPAMASEARARWRADRT
jgi:glycerophosphoryl diester phosphodiesterase